MSFERLIRFETDDGNICYGNLTKEMPTREIVGQKVEVLEGSVQDGLSNNGDEATVAKVRPASILVWG